MSASKTKSSTGDASQRVRISAETALGDADSPPTARSVEKRPRAAISLSLQAAVRVSEVLSHADQYIKPLGRCIWREAAQISSCSADGEEIRDSDDGEGRRVLFGDEQVDAIVREWDAVFFEAWYTLRGNGDITPWKTMCGIPKPDADEPNVLSFTLPSNTTMTTPFLDGAFSAVFDQLWAEAEPSPFGDMTTHETRVDESVRKGRELLAGKHWTVNAGFVKDLATSVWKLHPAKVRVVPYKLNMYQAGGGFAWHADTPEKDLVGTILVGLCEHEGEKGAEKGFKIKHGSMENEWSCLTKRTYAYWKHQPPSWLSNAIAFYADCPHNVEVKEGKRATLAFKVFTTTRTEEKTKARTTEKTTPGGGGAAPSSSSASSSSPSSSSSSPSASSSSGAVLPASARIPAMLTSELRDLFGFVLSKTGAVGIILDHAYNLHASELKGVDARMFEFLQQVPNVDLQIIPVVVRDNFCGSYEECEPPNSVSVSVYSLTDADLAHATDATKAEVSDQFPHLNEVPFFFHNSTGYGGTKGKKISASHVPYAAYTGNESQPESAESVYLYRAVIVTPNASFVMTHPGSGEDDDVKESGGGEK